MTTGTAAPPGGRAGGVGTAAQMVGVLGTGSYLPDRTVDNHEMADTIGVTLEWIERKTKIRERRYASAHQATSDLAVAAAHGALADAGLTADDIDYLIVSTSTGDSPQPPTAYLVQSALRAWRAACFDVNVVCSGFVYGIALAQGMLALRPDAIAVVIAAEVYSRFIDFSDRRTAVLLGDGAGAAVLGAVPAPSGIVAVDLRSRGDLSRLIRVDAGGSRLPASHATVDEGGHYFRMEGRDVAHFVRTAVPDSIQEILKGADLEPADVDHFVPHQANGVLLDAVAELSPLPRARMHRTVDRYGNTGSASVPVTLDEANRNGAIRAGQLVLIASFGGGMSMGNCLLRWGRA